MGILYNGPVSDNERNDSPDTLLRLIQEANLESLEGAAGRRIVLYNGRYRDWSLSINLGSNWLTVQTYVCEVPKIATLRAALFAEAMAINHAIALGKFATSGALTLEAEYRAEHVDAGVLGNILSLLVETAEEYYPRLFRAVSGDATLGAIESDANLLEAA